MEIAFIILTWNSQRDIKDCIDSIIAKCESEKIEYELNIVDNGSTDQTVEIIQNYRKGNSKINLHELDSNHGTTWPRNIALKKTNKKNICIIDSDTKQLDGSLAKLLELLENDKSIGLIAPKLILMDGSIQHSVKKIPTFLNKILKSFKIFGIGRYHQNDFYEDFPFAEKREVETAISACWFLRREILDRVGYLDEKIFYAPEDLDYSIRVWKNGMKILFYPEYTIYHKTQQITHAKPFSKISWSHFWGLVYYFKKHRYWFSRKSIREKYFNHVIN